MDGNLLVAETAHIVCPYHRELDEQREILQGKNKIGQRCGWFRESHGLRLRVPQFRTISRYAGSGQESVITPAMEASRKTSGSWPRIPPGDRLQTA